MILETVLGVLASLGIGGGIVLTMGSFLGRLWAERLMASETANHSRELERLRQALVSEQKSSLARLNASLAETGAKRLGAHQDKLSAYREATDIVADLIAELTSASGVPAQLSGTISDFSRRRLRLYGIMALVSPQSVMDAHDRLFDRLLDVVHDGSPMEWSEFRTLALELINEIRLDLGVDPTPIEYHGTR